MKTSDVELLIVPGWGNSGPDHWQTRWERKLSTARRVEQADWETPRLADWTGRIIEAVALAKRPVVIVAHSLGVTATVHAASKMPTGLVAGALLVAPPDLDGLDIWPAKEGGFAPYPMVKLPFGSALVASSTDPYCTTDRAGAMSDAWGSSLLEAGAAGHINTESGHGPWPEGLMQLGWLLKRLG